MRFGFVLPGGSASALLEQAALADEAGWDAVFVWEAAYGLDPWSLLAAMAMRTDRVRLGTMLTPLPWRRPWKVASQAATLDQLSGGRAILAVGLGAVEPLHLGDTGEATERRVRAERLDEGIDLITGLWSGEGRFAGAHYAIDMSHATMLLEAAVPVQQPRVPIWVPGVWPKEKSLRRSQRCDGILPSVYGADGLQPPTSDDIVAIIEWLDANGGRRPGFDVVWEGETPADDSAAAADIVRPWADAGCTWWLETRWNDNADLADRIAAGPPAIAG